MANNEKYLDSTGLGALITNIKNRYDGAFKSVTINTETENDSTNHFLVFSKVGGGNDIKVNVNSFVKDGMLKKVEVITLGKNETITGYPDAGEGDKFIKFTWNTDATDVEGATNSVSYIKTDAIGATYEGGFTNVGATNNEALDTIVEIDDSNVIRLTQASSSIIKTSQKIPVAGGPLSELLTKNNITEIDAGMDLQSLLFQLFCKENWPSSVNWTSAIHKTTHGNIHVNGKTDLYTAPSIKPIQYYTVTQSTPGSVPSSCTSVQSNSELTVTVSNVTKKCCMVGDTITWDALYTSAPTGTALNNLSLTSKGFVDGTLGYNGYSKDGSSITEGEATILANSSTTDITTDYTKMSFKRDVTIGTTLNSNLSAAATAISTANAYSEMSISDYNHIVQSGDNKIVYTASGIVFGGACITDAITSDGTPKAAYNHYGVSNIKNTNTYASNTFNPFADGANKITANGGSLITTTGSAKKWVFGTSSVAKSVTGLYAGYYPIYSNLIVNSNNSLIKNGVDYTSIKGDGFTAVKITADQLKTNNYYPGAEGSNNNYFYKLPLQACNIVKAGTIQGTEISFGCENGNRTTLEGGSINRSHNTDNPLENGAFKTDSSFGRLYIWAPTKLGNPSLWAPNTLDSKQWVKVDGWVPTAADGVNAKTIHGVEYKCWDVFGPMGNAGSPYIIRFNNGLLNSNLK